MTYALAAVLGSSAGSLWTWTSDVWSDADPLVSGPQTALFTLGPAIALIAAARLSARQVSGVAAVLVLAMIAMWYLFAGNASSTSSVVFLWGWLVGVPVAVAVVGVDVWRSQRASAASDDGRTSR